MLFKEYLRLQRIELHTFVFSVPSLVLPSLCLCQTRLTADKSMRLLLSTFNSLREELLHMSEDLRVRRRNTSDESQLSHQNSDTVLCSTVLGIWIKSRVDQLCAFLESWRETGAASLTLRRQQKKIKNCGNKRKQQYKSKLSDHL